MSKFFIPYQARVNWSAPEFFGEKVEVLTEPNEDGMVKARLIKEVWISVDDIEEG